MKNDTLPIMPITSAVHRIQCRAGRPKLISLVRPAQGYTAWCQQCRLVHPIQWSDLPSDALRDINEAIHRVLAERATH